MWIYGDRFCNHVCAWYVVNYYYMCITIMLVRVMLLKYCIYLYIYIICRQPNICNKEKNALKILRTTINCILIFVYILWSLSIPTLVRKRSIESRIGVETANVHVQTT